MRPYALGIAAVIALALPAMADSTTSRVQLAQAASDNGQSGSGAGTTQNRREGGARNGASAESRGSESRSHGVREGNERSMNTRANVRGGEDRSVTRSQRFGSRTTIHARIGSRDRDDVRIHRRSLRRHVYNEPSTTVIKRKKFRRHAYSEPSSVMIRHKKVRRYVEGGSVTVRRHHRPGITVGVSTSVRERSGGRVKAEGSTTRTRSTTTGERSGGNTTVRNNESGQGGGNARGNMRSRSTSGSESGGASRGGASGGSSGNRQ